jgi:hypothetical protein
MEYAVKIIGVVMAHVVQRGKHVLKVSVIKKIKFAMVFFVPRMKLAKMGCVYLLIGRHAKILCHDQFHQVFV